MKCASRHFFGTPGTPKGTDFASPFPGDSGKKGMVMTALSPAQRTGVAKLVLVGVLSTTMLAGLGYASMGLMHPTLERLDLVNQQLAETNKHLTYVNKKLDSMMDQLNHANEQLTATNEKLSEVDKELAGMTVKLDSMDKQLGEAKQILTSVPQQLNELNDRFGQFRRFIMKR
jgi:septal ring factor EnvC (AmiA/AmiB activator)